MCVRWGCGCRERKSSKQEIPCRDTHALPEWLGSPRLQEYWGGFTRRGRESQRPTELLAAARSLAGRERRDPGMQRHSKSSPVKDKRESLQNEFMAGNQDANLEHVKGNHALPWQPKPVFFPWHHRILSPTPFFRNRLGAVLSFWCPADALPQAAY